MTGTLVLVAVALVLLDGLVLLLLSGSRESREERNETVALPDRPTRIDDRPGEGAALARVCALPVSVPRVGPDAAAKEFRTDQFTRERLARLARIQGRRQ